MSKEPGPTIALSQVSFIGRDLARPECVLCDDRGVVHASDWRGGVTRIYPDGGQETILATNMALRPNGICLLADGGYLIAHLGDDDGGVFHLTRNGRAEAFLTHVDGVALAPTNYVHQDTVGRVWISVSTRHVPRADAYRSDIADGFVLAVIDGQAHMAADGLGYTNECLIDPSGRWLYVNETFARRTSRFAVTDDGMLGDRETVATFGPGVFPDGLTFDTDGGIWITSIVSNTVIRIAPTGQQEVVLRDADPEHVNAAEKAYLAHGMGRPHLDKAGGEILKNISSLAFGGADRKTAYLGCLLGDQIATFQAPVAGALPAHWAPRSG